MEQESDTGTFIAATCCLSQGAGVDAETVTNMTATRYPRAQNRLFIKKIPG